MTTSANKVWVVLPAFREEGRIGKTVHAVKTYCPQVLVVDDGSPDHTAREAEAAGAEVLRHPENRGKGVALATGFQAALDQACSAVITLDADGQHNPAEIPAFLEAWSTTGDAVIVGNRMPTRDEMPLVRKLTNKAMSGFLSLLMGQRVPDTQNGYRLYAAEAIPFVRSESRGFAAESEQLLYLADHGFRIGSVPVTTIYGTEKSKIRPVRDTVRFFNMVLRYYRHRRQRRRADTVSGN